ncbi:hypothetical protein [Crateriforma spongiae]|uniref:hypothetical protein n=1 Tax=Crateriforma spongiae TaxID=2724528 RepID=UPI001446748E|nr:hypothetical protein [Crateriforma spongiae]
MAVLLVYVALVTLFCVALVRGIRRSRSGASWSRHDEPTEQVTSRTPTVDSIFGLFSGLSMFLMFFAVSLSTLLIAVDRFFMPLELAARIPLESGWDPAQWKTNLSTGPHNVSQSYTHWRISQGDSSTDASRQKSWLLMAFPVIVALTLLTLLLFQQISKGFIHAATEDWVRQSAEEELADIRSAYHRNNLQRRQRYSNR